MFGLKYLKNVATLILDQKKCTGCRICTIVCPHQVFEMNRKKAVIIDFDACMECGACARNCPAEAISVNAAVGCATAVIHSKLKGLDEISCGCECSNQVKGTCCCG